MDPCFPPHLGCTIQGQLSTLMCREGELSFHTTNVEESLHSSQRNNLLAGARPHSVLIAFATTRGMRFKQLPVSEHSASFFLAQISQSRAENAVTAVANFPFITLVTLMVDNLLATLRCYDSATLLIKNVTLLRA